MLTRLELQRIARLRAIEARTLRRKRQWSGAYYLAGLAVECALKARIAKSFQRHAWPDKGFVNRIYTHDLPKLVELAGLKPDLDREQAANPQFKYRWGVVKDWGVNDRYKEWQAREAQDMVDAVAHIRHGVLPWIRTRW